ncbi:MAG: Spy/CpxP family protein refolding chaperone [Halothece sp.]
MSFRHYSFLTILLLSLSTTTALAQNNFNFSSSETPVLTAQFSGNDFGFRQGHQRRETNLLDNLNLSEEQKNQLQTIRTDYQPRMIEQREQMAQANQTLREMMHNNPSTEELRNQHEQVQGLRQEMANLRFERMLEMREVLNPEQREQFAELMQERRGNRGGNRRW